MQPVLLYRCASCISGPKAAFDVLKRKLQNDLKRTKKTSFGSRGKKIPGSKIAVQHLID